MPEINMKEDKRINAIDKKKFSLPKPEPKAVLHNPTIAIAVEIEKDQQVLNQFTMDSQAVMQGIIWSEILGKPKSKRRGR